MILTDKTIIDEIAAKNFTHPELNDLKK